jgi:hypothetical protein
VAFVADGPRGNSQRESDAEQVLGFEEEGADGDPGDRPSFAALTNSVDARDSGTSEGGD